MIKNSIRDKAILAYEKGRNLHAQCYPFGLSNSYQECVALFADAMVLAEASGDARLHIEIAWALRDAQADTAYYPDGRLSGSGGKVS